jgi:hypothetical protein
MAGRDFFISYTAVDRVWAKWIAVELERAGYTTISQVLDFEPGNDFVHAMQVAARTAERTIAVLSPAYAESDFAESEWRPAFAEDPTGELRRLIPVRVQPGPPPGLLRSRIFIDFVGVDEDTARELLLDGVSRRGERPTSAPFPGTAATAEHLPFPGGAATDSVRPDGYLRALPTDQAEALRAVNGPGLAALRSYLARGEAVAFLGAGVSAPLYPLWTDLIGQLVDAAVERGLGTDAAATCRALAGTRPDSVVEVLRRHLGAAQFQAALRHAFRVRRDPDTGRTWTPVHELVCRCAFRAVVTTNYDPGIVDARMRVRPMASGTGFTSWTDELALDRWRTGDVFGDDELPVLFAHGHHNQPDAMVLATSEYRRAYGGKLGHVLGRIIDADRVVWIGFGFGDPRIAAVLREVAERSGTRIDPGRAARHVAIMPWDPDGGEDPQTLRVLAEIEFGADLVLYPALRHDRGALHTLLGSVTDGRYPPVPALDRPVRPVSKPERIPIRWVHGAEEARSFTGRSEELAKLDRWAADPTVRLIGVTAWGGAGKTALVTHWLQQTGGAAKRAGARGVFAWSFYSDPSVEHWAAALAEWAATALGVRLIGRGNAAAVVAAITRSAPVVLVLDGLEVNQEGPASDAYGRLISGALREVLSALCRVEHRSLVVLTSRFPFADVQGFDGTTARMLDVPPFTPAEGAALLDAVSPGAVGEADRLQLVAEVDGHALAVTTIAALLADHPEATTRDLLERLAEPDAAPSKISRVLTFYAQRLTEPDRYLVAAVSLFARPVTPDQILTVARHEVFAGRLDGWDARLVQAAVRGRLAGLLTWHPDGCITAHPLIRQAFRPLGLGAAELATDVTLTDTPTGPVATREHALRIVEAIELLIDADQWKAADDLYRTRTANSDVWRNLPAARLGQRAATAFVATPNHRHICAVQLSRRRLSYYVTVAGMYATETGDLDTAHDNLRDGVRYDREADDRENLSVTLLHLTECLGRRGQARAATTAATQSLTYADDRRADIADAHVCLAWSADLAGDTATAERHYNAADHVRHHDDPDGDHLHSGDGIWWSEFLARTGRAGPARRLAVRSHEIHRERGWTAGFARCQVLLARINLDDLASPDLRAAGKGLKTALRTFRDGDYLVDLADALTVAARHARRALDLAEADDHITEALGIAAPRGLTLVQAAVLTERAHLAADHHAAGDLTHLPTGRDAGDAALRLTTGADPLPWLELDALRALARLDEIEGLDHGHRRQAEFLHRRLVPDGLDPDPLATIEKELAAKRANERDAEGI